MGNQQGSDFGGVVIRTDKPFYFAGEVVTGNIYMNIFRDGFPGRVVLLKVTGKEKCHWTETHTEQVRGHDGKYQTKTRYVTYDGKTQFYQHRIAIWTFQTPTLPVGQYTFPFQFQLLSHLPGSLFEKGSDYFAKTSYRVKAEIESYSNSFKSIKHVQPFIVREPLKSNIAALMGEMQVNATTWCCCEQGTSYIKCVFDKNNYLPGDTAYLWVDLDNSNCKLDVTSIQATFTNTLILRSRSGREKVVRRTYATQSIQGIQAGVKAIENDRKQMQLLLHDKRSPGGINPSSNGQIIRSLYRLQVKAVLSGCTCCSSHPAVDVPIEIVAPVPQFYNEPIPQPSNWNPQVFQPQIVSFTDSTMYLKDPQQPSNYNYPAEQNQFGQMVQPMN